MRTELRDRFVAAPLRTLRPVDVADMFARPDQGLDRLAARGQLQRPARGTYTLPPDDADRWFELTPEQAAVCWAAPRCPGAVVAHLGAARHWHAIPRAIGMTVITLDVAHSPVTLAREVHMEVLRRATPADTVEVHGPVGAYLVTSPAQTAQDLLRWRDMGYNRQDLADAVRALQQMAEADALGAGV